MRRALACLVLFLCLAAVGVGWADPPVTIFRVQIDLPNPGDFYNPIQDVNYQGTVFFKNNSGSELRNVTMRVTMWNRRDHTYGAWAEYPIGTVDPGAIVNQNYRIPTAADIYLLPVVRVKYELNGVTGEQHTSPTETFY